MNFRTSWADLNIKGGIILALQLVCAVAAECFLGAFSTKPEALAGAARIATVFLSLFVVHTFALRGLSGYNTQPLRNAACLYLGIVCTLILANFSRIFSLGLESYLARGFSGVVFSPESLFFAIPFPTGALIIQAVLGLHFGLVFSLCLAILMGVYSPEQVIAVPYVFCTCVVACLSILRFRSRSAYLKAGLNVMLTAAPLAIGSLLLVDDVRTADVVTRLFGAVVCGILSSFLAAGGTPLVENIGGYATDLRLIEMATLDHPLLKQLSIQAPGTWNHSMVMGMMVESAADGVGANPVICRVGAYFHDVGKMNKPLYFVENQTPGENRHDRLSPSMSALIIRSHVKDGIELARKYKMPKVIEDMIPQHHGTSIIEYFYDKARRDAEEAGEDLETVERASYAYPGPRPQTREAGILMLADGIEAAARTLSEPTFDRIQGMVQKMINKVFASGELEECELTLKDLHLIAKCFTRVLTGIYHQRIAYAEPAEKTNSAARAKDTDQNTDEAVGDGSARRGKPAGEEPAGKEGGGEDLKRLGL